MVLQKEEGKWKEWPDFAKDMDEELLGAFFGAIAEFRAKLMGLRRHYCTFRFPLLCCPSVSNHSV